MKHALFLIVLAVAGYFAYQLSDPKERKLGVRVVTRHGMRLLLIIIVLLLLLAAASQLPSTQLI